MRKLALLLIVSLSAYILLAPNFAKAEYNPTTGRFLQRDPLGVIPGANKYNRFSPKEQYSDGVNLYQYVKSKPTFNRDPFGLIQESDWEWTLTNNGFYPSSSPETYGQYCCKIETSTSVPIGGDFNGIRHRIMKTCSQKTIADLSGKDPMKACKCRYKNQPNISVYGAERGSCCSCNLYFMYHDMGELGWIQYVPILRGSPHGRLVGICSDGRVWTAQIHDNDTVETHDSASENDDDTSDPVRTYVKNWDRWKKKYIGKTSCKHVDDFMREIEQNPTYPYSEYWNNCWDYAHRWGRKLGSLCP